MSLVRNEFTIALGLRQVRHRHNGFRTRKRSNTIAISDTSVSDINAARIKQTSVGYAKLNQLASGVLGAWTGQGRLVFCAAGATTLSSNSPLRRTRHVFYPAPIFCKRKYGSRYFCMTSFNVRCYIVWRGDQFVIVPSTIKVPRNDT